MTAGNRPAPDFTGWPWQEGQMGNQPRISAMNKEEVYDSQISPLMQQIIAITREHGIAMVASFDIAHDGEGPNGEDCSSLTCTTHLPDGDEKPNERFAQAAQVIQRRAHHCATLNLTTQHADGTKTLTAII
jgi:hypothetical protein